MQGTWENGQYVLASTKDDKIARLEREKVKLRQEIESALIALGDMVSVAESQGWDNAEIHNARDILSNIGIDKTNPTGK